MKVAVLVKATPSSEAGLVMDEATQALFAEMGKYNETLIAAGIMKDAAGLKPSADGVRVRFQGKERSVVAGPFAAINELVAGYWIWEVPSLEEAIAWVKRCPNPMPETSEIEIRPLFCDEDFAAAPESQPRAKQRDPAVAMRQSTVQTYLFFGGRCEEAIAFYREALHATVGMMMRWSDSPEPPPPGMLGEGFEAKIMHADFTVGGTTIMASDGCGGPQDHAVTSSGFRLTLTVPTEALADHAFNALAAGGHVDMPLMKTFWSPRYGMVTDRFGIGWMVMVPGQQP